MDDDDFYPPERVTHAVDRLRSQPRALCAGSSIVYIYFNDLDKIYQFGPYGPMHATAGTFAFKRELLKQTRYDDDAEIAEEKAFLKNYTVPLVQLDPMKAILVFAHQFNTFDKRRLLVNPHPNFVRETKLKPKYVIPKMSPFSAIKFLAKESIGKKSNNAGFHFYETSNGFHFNGFSQKK